MRVLGISGSLRADSLNTRLLRAAAPLLPPGARLEVYDGLRDVPPYDEDHEQARPRPDAVRALDRAIAGADAVLFATPEYNASIPGQLKNALDWVSRPLAQCAARGKPVAVIGASTGIFGAVWAQAELRKVLATLGARVIGDEEIPIAQADGAFAADGSLADPDRREAVGALLAELVQAADVERELAAA